MSWRIVTPVEYECDRCGARQAGFFGTLPEGWSEYESSRLAGYMQHACRACTPAPTPVPQRAATQEEAGAP